MVVADIDGAAAAAVARRITDAGGAAGLCVVSAALVCKYTLSRALAGAEVEEVWAHKPGLLLKLFFLLRCARWDMARGMWPNWLASLTGLHISAHYHEPHL